MITSTLMEEYEARVGPVTFTLARLSPDMEEKVAEMMREVIAGNGRPITAEELGQKAPADAET